MTEQRATKTPFHTRLSPDVQRFLRALAEKKSTELGIKVSMTDIIEMEIREAAKREKIK